MSSLNFPIYILGDLSLNLLNSGSRDARALVGTPTCITESSKSLLDVILASNAIKFRRPKSYRAQSAITIWSALCYVWRSYVLSNPCPILSQRLSRQVCAHVHIVAINSRTSDCFKLSLLIRYHPIWAILTIRRNWQTLIDLMSYHDKN